MPTGIGNGIAGDVFQNNLGAGGGGGAVICPSQYSLLFNGTTQVTFMIPSQSYNLGATNSSLSVWINTSDRNGVSGTGQAVYTSSNGSSGALSVYFDAGGDLKSTLGTMTFPSFPELITNGNFAYGQDKLTGFTNGITFPFTTFTISGKDITSAINTSSFAGAVSNGFSVVSGEVYTVTFTYAKNSGDDLRIVFSDSTSGAGGQISNLELITTSGTYTRTFTINSTATGYFQVGTNSSSSSLDFELTNVSIIETTNPVSWTLGTGWTVEDDKAVFTGTSDAAIYQAGVTTLNKYYKVSVEVLANEGTATNTILLGTNEINATHLGVGVHTFYGQALNNTILYLFGRANEGFEVTNISVSEFISEDEWHHLALSIDRSGDWKWYIDGALTNTLANGNSDVPTLSGISGFTLSNNFFVGPLDYTNGYMTEPSLWNVALSASEVKSIYDNMYGGQKCLGVLPFSSDLITNGKFNQIGPELITNGDFSVGVEKIVDGDFPLPNVNWTLNTGWTIPIGGSADCDGTQSATSGLIQGSVFTSGNSYKLSFDITSNAEDFKFWVNGTQNIFDEVLSDGSKEYYFVATATGSAYFEATASFIGTISNVSVKELGEDWNVGTGWSIANNKASVDTVAATAELQQSSLSVVAGKSYKISLEVSNIVAGSELQIEFSAGNVVGSVTSDGEFTFYGEWGVSSILYLYALNTSKFSVTNITLKEVGQNWEAGFSGSGDVTFPNGTARIVTGANPNSAFIRQFSVMEIGKSYTMTYSIVSNNGGTLFNSGQTPSTMDSTVGSHSETFIAGSENILISRVSDNTDISITNVTLTQVGGGNLERWWRMNGTDASAYITANQAPNGTVNPFTPVNVPQIVQEVP